MMVRAALRHFHISIALVALVFVLPHVALAQTATLSFSPSTGTYAEGKSFTVNVIVDSGSQSVNSANATILFDKEFLSAVNVSKTGSAFGLWAVEPTLSNSEGTVNFEGGNTTPVSGKKTLIGITFKALKQGSATVSFKDGTVLAADGKGTNILGDKLPSTFTIGPPGETTPQPKPSDSGGSESNGLTPDAPEITSTSHPDPLLWYSTTTGKFAWENPIDITGARVLLDQDEKSVPLVTYEPAITEKEIEGLKLGVNWFHVRLKNAGGWGATAHRKVLVDNQPPLQFTVTATPDTTVPDSATVLFTATDTLSGIDRYEIIVVTGEVKKVKESDIKEKGYTLTLLSPGGHAIKVFAYDKAGNKTEGSTVVSVVGIPEVNAGGTGEEVEKPSVFTGQYILSMVLAAILAFLIGYLIYGKRITERDRIRLKRETDEVREKLETIFSVLRQEIEEQVNMLAQKPNPSAQDREVQERLREALDISEELIDKEIEDVRKLVS